MAEETATLAAYVADLRFDDIPEVCFRYSCGRSADDDDDDVV